MTGPAVTAAPATVTTPPPERRVSDDRGLIRRWAADLAMGARFAWGGGREGWVRTALTALGVGVGVAVLLVGASVPTLQNNRQARSDARENFRVSEEPPAPSDHSLLQAETDTEFRGEGIHGRTLQPDGGHPAVPPGVAELPGPGEMLVSPALRELLASSEGALLRERLPARVTGTIGDEGLLDPHELAYYAGSDELTKSQTVRRVDGFGMDNDRPPLEPELLLLTLVICVVLLLPVAAFVAAATRFGGDRRDRRLAALRLVGADARTTRRVAGGESATGAALGLLVGAAMFLPLRQLIAHNELMRLSAFASDVTPSAALIVLIALAVPACAVLVTLLGLRGVAIEPLGVVRRTGVRRRRVWWRLVPVAAGIALLLPLADGIKDDEKLDTYPIAGGLVLVLVGVTALLPWLVEATALRMRGRAVPVQLAVRRLQLDSGTASRAVSGITVAVAGAIALQMLFGAVERQQTAETGQDPSRAQMLVVDEAAHGDRAPAMARRMADTPGVRDALGLTVDYAFEAGKDPEEVTYDSVTVAGCTALRELARLGSCTDGDVFVVRPGKGEDSEQSPGARPGGELDFATPQYDDPLDGPRRKPILWTVPKDARVVPARLSPMGTPASGILATPSALDGSRLENANAEVYLRLDKGVPDAVEHVRNTTAATGPTAMAHTLESTDKSEEFAAIQRALYGGAVAILLLIGASMAVSTVEQLRERKQLLSVLVAFGTRRSTLALSVLWQTALPVLLGLALAAGGGLLLGALLLKMVEMPVSVDWVGLGAMTGLGGTLILVVTLVSLPVLWRLMRPDGLHTE